MVAGGGWFQRGPGEQRDVAAGQTMIIRDYTSQYIEAMENHIKNGDFP
jgi:hypothetical protein